MGARFSVPVQTGPGAHPVSYTVGTGSSPGIKRPGCGYTSASAVGLCGLLRGELTFTFKVCCHGRCNIVFLCVCRHVGSGSIVLFFGKAEHEVPKSKTVQ